MRLPKKTLLAAGLLVLSYAVTRRWEMRGAV